MSYLFECAIGPVQDFIATARRSRDLRYGSWMLSELSKAAAKSIADSGGQLIFPTVTTSDDLFPDSKFNAPNKVVAVVSNAPIKVANAARSAVGHRLHHLRDGAFEAIRNFPVFDLNLANAQVDDLVEFYWVSVQFDGNEGYGDARRLAEALLSARKATRDFDQVTGEMKPKSSLDGARESAIDDKAYPAPRDTEADKQKKAKVLERFKARPAERLSGVDILKRLGESRSDVSSFPSTSDVAARPFLRHVDINGKTGDRSQLLNEINKLLADNAVILDETDGALVFSSRLAELMPDQTRAKDVASNVEEILKKYADGVRPQPYYALLVADGDNMGAAIDHLSTHQDAQTRHSELSLALSRFAAEVNRIVDRHQGALVYSGGDDIMAYLPLHTALGCAHELAKEFSSAMAEFTLDSGATPTLSTGIVVAHHLEPLSDTLDLARSAEKAAKTVNGKHGLAITVSKRSGTDRTIKGKREELGARLEQMIEWRRNGAIAAGVAYELQELDRVLGQSGLTEDALIEEALRIIDRKREAGGNKKIDAEVRSEFELWIKHDKIKLQELALELIVASMFATAIDMAKGTPKE